MSNDKQGYRFPPRSILHHYDEIDGFEINPSTDARTDILVKVFKQFGTEAWIERIFQGPTFRQYRFGFEQGTFNSSILKNACTFGLNILADDVRIIPPEPKSPFICIEVPNEKRSTVGFEKMISALEDSRASIPMVLGMDVEGNCLVADATSLQHVLILGDTGSGKTVFINSLVSSVLYSKTPAQVRLQIADCNYQGLSVYNGIPHFISPMMAEPQEVLDALKNLCLEMERRMVLFKNSSATSIRAYNNSMEQKGSSESILPYIVFIIDEFEPLMNGFRTEFEFWIKRITAVARFCGIHLVLSTRFVDQDIISTVVRRNIPSTLTFRIKDAARQGRGIVTEDASKLQGRGDFLYVDPFSQIVRRIQGALIEAEIDEIVSFAREKSS